MSKEIWLLTQLGRYKYLSASQLQRLWWPESKKSLYSLLSKLKELSFIDRHTYKFDPKLWSVEDIYFLRTKGVRYLDDRWHSIKDIKMPSSKTVFYDDYVHRKKCIDCQISLCQYIDALNIDSVMYLHYFETIVSAQNWRRQTATKISYDWGSLKSDAVCLVSDNNSSEVFLLIEIHNGNRVQRMVDTIKNYSHILSQWSASVQFNSSRNPRIIIVFEHEQTLRSVLEHVSMDRYYSYLLDYYWLATYDDLLVAPWDCRINLAGQKKSLDSLFQNKN